MIALECDHRIDSLVVAFHQALGQKSVRVGEENLSDEERVIWAIESLEGEVNNGGYGQVFINSSKEYAPIVVEALTRIGCPKTEASTRRAIEALNIDGPVTEEAVDAAMAQDDDDRDKKLDACDNKYFASREDIEGCLFEFIKSNKVEISL